MKYKNEYTKNIKREYESKFNEYRDIDEEETNNCINKKLGEFSSHKSLQELSLNDLLWDFDAVSLYPLYPSAMSDPESVCQRRETGYAYTPDMKDELVEKFNNQTFTQGSAILKIKNYNPKNLLVQHLPVKERVNKMEISRMRNGSIIDTPTSVDIQELLRLG